MVNFLAVSERKISSSVDDSVSPDLLPRRWGMICPMIDQSNSDFFRRILGKALETLEVDNDVPRLHNKMTISNEKPVLVLNFLYQCRQKHLSRTCAP
ncbi:hypothetical protein TNIN_317131 [Trichonephila inaurata madagascariensis]|uniref:Uncharacterized protein n=1 Tax=Trichonephila inaurata madagascariensis TaxID=2747483 RepID=A0A8X7C8P2_9ARAC|nr:hypothetical protein TNIN_317131 [Trichonephila inaurata madagascariensis]